MKRISVMLLTMSFAIGLLAGCASGKTSGKEEITAVSREEGSGTRGAFIELFGIRQKDASKTNIDYTTEDANITNSTQVMLTSVSGGLMLSCAAIRRSSARCLQPLR